MIEEGKVQPLHIGGAELARERRISQIAAQVVVHAFTAGADNQGAKIQIAEKTAPQQRAEIRQRVLVADFDEVGAFGNHDLLESAPSRQKLVREDHAIAGIERRSRSLQMVNLRKP